MSYSRLLGTVEVNGTILTIEDLQPQTQIIAPADMHLDQYAKCSTPPNYYEYSSTVSQTQECHQNSYMQDGVTNPSLSESGAMSSSSTERSNSRPPMQGSSRKRKSSSHKSSSSGFDDQTKDSKSTTDDSNKKQNHSEIEKRRRDKMNAYITELSAMVPMSHAMSHKLDKLTVLRMAVQHLKTIRGTVHSYTEGNYKPNFLSDQDLKTLILEAADGFLFVVGCDRGRILYVSESVVQVLNYTQNDLLGQSWFDILHPKDVAKVKEQLSSSDLNPRDRLIDAKTMQPVMTDMPQGVSRMCPGARRSFFCRMKSKVTTPVKVENETKPNCQKRKKQQGADRRYLVIQCTGYLKSWAPAKIGVEEPESDVDSEFCNFSCLVAVGRLQPAIYNPLLQYAAVPNTRSIQFISRHAMDGKFLFIDQRATLVLEYLPQELLGTSMYEYFHRDDIIGLAEVHKTSLLNPNKVTTTLPYRMRSKNGNFVLLQSEFKSFKNPWTKEIEYLISKNTVILSDSSRFVHDGNPGNRENAHGSMTQNFEFFNQSNDREIHRIINSHVETSKIGSQIAEEVLEIQRRNSESSTDNSPDPNSSELGISSTTSIEGNSSPCSSSPIQGSNQLSSPMLDQNNGKILPHFDQVRNNVTLASNNEQSNSVDGEMIGYIANASVPNANEGNVVSNVGGEDEAAMAVLMSLLEADAELGGPVDFSGLPWPMP